MKARHPLLSLRERVRIPPGPCGTALRRKKAGSPADDAGTIVGSNNTQEKANREKATCRSTVSISISMRENREKELELKRKKRFELRRHGKCILLE